MTHDDTKTAEPKNSEFEENIKLCDKVPVRLILYFLSLSAMIVLFVMRSIMPITLLAMVKDQPHEGSNGFTIVCLKKGINSTSTRTDYGGTLEWSRDVQYYILTSFFWSYIAAQVLGGATSQKFGTKVVVGYGFLIASICNICIPFASSVHYALVIILQVVQGLAQGVTWPSLYGLISSWVPVYERSRFVTAFQGISVGTTIGQVMAGFVISRFGWSYVFFIAGGISVLWCFVWYFFAYDTPELHPRISSHELKYIQDNRGSVDKTNYDKIPWKSIITSIPIWAIAITSFGRMWLNLTIGLYGSLYLKTVIGLDVESNGLWSGLPSTACLLSSFLFSCISDKLLKHDYMSLIKSRKLFSGISQIIPGILSICFGYLNCNVPLILIVWCLLQIVPTASYSGSMVNVLDLTPNFTGPAMGFIQIFLMSPSILATFVAKTIIQNESTSEKWKTIFNIAGVVNIITCAIYFIFASSKVQNWDKIKHANKEEIQNEEDKLV
ncbi:hypothetical protein RN001_014127 [Aquatica leii]|uniref:Major facilitator superfamily (MFS) profile domain-containing protein n=1 Tax=Aquatica leii TaxID=1421715 RepID=A0AAN7P1N2_9COLE|nr:hypothetical protein RN001_014127 [Aquatica leii]